MLVNRAVKVKLYPTALQEQYFRKQSGCCRFVYNWGLVTWKELHEKGEKTSVFTLNRLLSQLKLNYDYGWLNEVGSQSLQQSLADLGNAYSRFFKTKKGFPQFKKKGQKDSFRIPQCFEVLSETNRLKLPKIGYVKYRNKTPIKGIVKSITISKQGGNWYASILSEVEVEGIHHPSASVIGVDVGIANLVTTYDGDIGEKHSHNSKLFLLNQQVKILHKRVSRKQKGSSNRKKAILKLSKLYQRIRNVRLDTLHKLSHALCKNHAQVVVEDLKIKNMSKSAKGTLENPGTNVSQKRGLNRSILNQGWRIFFDQLFYKAQRFGGQVVIVPPMHTSQTCPSCKHVSKDNRKTQASFSCVSCGYSEHADIVGAMNIRSLALTGMS